MPVQRRATGSSNNTHMDEKQKSALASIMKVIKGPEKCRRDSADGQLNNLAISKKSAFKQLVPATTNKAPCSQMHHTSHVGNKDIHPQLEAQKSNDQIARIETVRQLHSIM